MSKYEKCTEITLEIFWEGPFDQADIVQYSNGKRGLSDDEICKIECPSEKLKAIRNKYWTLYSAYGSHQLYGNDVLLYIGKTTRGTAVRLKEHDSWFDEERFGKTKFFVASISNFSTWADSPDADYGDDMGRFFNDDDIVDRTEALLIYSLAPARNTSGVNSTKKKINNIRLFNTGALGNLPPEISGKYWVE